MDATLPTGRPIRLRSAATEWVMRGSLAARLESPAPNQSSPAAPAIDLRIDPADLGLQPALKRS